MALTLYEQQQKNWDAIGERFPNMRDMSKHFTVCADMDRALGTSNAVSAWHRGRNFPLSVFDRAAEAFLKLRERHAPEPQKSAGNLLLVTGDADAISKARRVLGLIGCEVIDV